MNATQIHLLNRIVKILNFSETKLKSHAFKNIQKNQKILKVSNIKPLIMMMVILIVLLLLSGTSLLHIFLAAGRSMDNMKDIFVIKKSIMCIHMKMSNAQRL